MENLSWDPAAKQTPTRRPPSRSGASGPTSSPSSPSLSFTRLAAAARGSFSLCRLVRNIGHQPLHSLVGFIKMRLILLNKNAANFIKSNAISLASQNVQL